MCAQEVYGFRVFESACSGDDSSLLPLSCGRESDRDGTVLCSVVRLSALRCLYSHESLTTSDLKWQIK